MIFTSANKIPSDINSRISIVKKNLIKTNQELLKEAEIAANLVFENDDRCKFSFFSDSGIASLYGASSIYRTWLNNNERDLKLCFPHGINIWDHFLGGLKSYNFVSSLFYYFTQS